MQNFLPRPDFSFNWAQLFCPSWAWASQNFAQELSYLEARLSGRVSVPAHT